MSSRNTPTFKSLRVKVGITIGDPSGVGPEIILPAIKKLRQKADFTVIGDARVFKKAIRNSPLPSGLKLIDLKNVNLGNFSFGKIKAGYGKASIEYLDKALELIRQGQIDCLVTCPISKEAINLAGFNFPGHTEYLAEKTGTKDFVMLLLNRRLKIGLVTRHIPLNKVPRKISQYKIYKTVSLIYISMRKLFLKESPGIVVCGLNPHASDNGLIGREEAEILRPALKKIRAEIGPITGPMSADAALFKALEKQYDCVVAMYHDQALIPLKLSDRKSGVNMTLGLPFVRTSPLHGTAFDIAGSGSADPSSLIEAINLAVKCTRNLKRA